MAGCERVAERLPGGDGVAVAPPVPRPGEIPGRFKVGDDLLYGPLGDPDLSCNFAQRDLRVARDDEEGVRMVGQERPARRSGWFMGHAWTGTLIRHFIDSSLSLFNQATASYGQCDRFAAGTGQLRRLLGLEGTVRDAAGPRPSPTPVPRR